LKETRPLWPPQRGVGLREPNLGKTNPRVPLVYSLAICFAPSLADSILFLTLTRLVVVFIFVNFSFALFTPPLGDYHNRISTDGDGRLCTDDSPVAAIIPACAPLRVGPRPRLPTEGDNRPLKPKSWKPGDRQHGGRRLPQHAYRSSLPSLLRE
jgi:hypothetical protein